MQIYKIIDILKGLTIPAVNKPFLHLQHNFQYYLSRNTDYGAHMNILYNNVLFLINYLIGG